MKNMKKEKYTQHLVALILCLIMGTTFIMPKILTAQTAQDDYEVLAPLPCIPTKSVDANGNPTGGTSCQDGENLTKISFKTYVQYAFNLLVALTAVTAVVMIVWGGLEYMTSLSAGGKSSGLNRVKNALVGLVLVLSSYLIIRTIDPRFVAIPTTLVPKLQLKDNLTKNTSGEFFNQLATDANYYHTETQEAIAAREAAKAAIDADLTKLNDLEKQYDQAVLDGNFDKTNELSNQITDLNEHISAAKSAQVYNTYKAAIDGTMNSLIQSRDPSGNIDLRGNSPATIKSAENLMDHAYTSGISKLQQSDSSPENIQNFKNDYFYSRSQLTMQEYVVGGKTSNQDIRTLQDRVHQDIDSTTDTNQKLQLQQRLVAVTATLKSGRK
jgi:hypothetical protein